jgi:serine protease Do
MNEITPRRNSGVWWVVGGALALLLFGCIATTTVVFFALRGGMESATSANLRPAPAQQVQPERVVAPAQAPVVVATPAGGVDYETSVLMTIYDQVNASVVNITNLADSSSIEGLPGSFHDGELLPLGNGSGFVWDADGHIVTNHHVVEGADELQVTFSDGTVSVATIVGTDPSSDLAVLKIDPTGYTLVPVRRGSLDAVRVGMRVAAIGNPFGLEGTLTSGIVSAIGRSIPALASFSIPNSIQTDAPINPGNSGGPLLNEQGEVIGVNAQIRSETGVNSGVGFAIPITIVERVVPALISDGEYQHSYLGVSGATLSPICADDLGLAPGVRGAYLEQVLPDTPADQAGLRGGEEESGSRYFNICPDTRGGDIVIAIEDRTVTSFDDVLTYLESDTSPGDTVTLRILRGGNEFLVDVTLAPRPERVEP